MASHRAKNRRPGYLAFQLLRTGFVIIPIVTGTDKFLHLLVNWDQYLSPAAAGILGHYTHAFMLGVGVMEIAFGIGMIFKPELFSFVISAWLLGIVLNLILTGAYFDIALRDFALVLATFALGELSQAFKKERPHEQHPREAAHHARPTTHARARAAHPRTKKKHRA